MDGLILRPSAEADLAAIQAIYAHHVRSGLGTFEEVAPPIEEIARRRAAVLDRGLPWLVAELEGEVAGYAYAAPFRLRAAYRYTVEDSVYVAPAALGRGVGRALLAELVGACEALGLRQMVAVIGDSGNAASVAVHRACGFELLASMPAVGFKFDRWVDVVWMQRPLNGGGTRPPDAAGLRLEGA